MKKLMKYICVLAVAAIATIVIMYNMASAEGEDEQPEVQPPTMSASKVSTNSDTATINVSFGGDIQGVTAGAITINMPEGISCSEGNSKLIDNTDGIASCTFTFTGFSSYSESAADITFSIGEGGSRWSYISKSDGSSKEVETELTATATVTINKQEENNNFTLSSGGTTVKVGDTIVLPEVTPPQIPVTWTSDNESIVIKQEDQFIAIGEGNATLTATAEGYNPQTFSVTVTGNGQSEDDFNLSFSEATVEVGESRDLPEITPPKDVTWTSDNENVVRIDGTKFVAIWEGNATLTATAGNKSKTLVVNVVGENQGENPGNNPGGDVDDAPPIIEGTRRMYVGEVARYGANKDVTWSSSNNSIAIVNETSGQITAIGEGTVTITATAKNGKKATAQIVVERRSEGSEAKNPVISPNSDFTINAGETYQLSADLEVEWTSLDETVATVDSNGLVKGVGGGSTFIYAKTKDLRASSVGVTVKGAKKNNANTGSTTTNKTGNAATENGNTSSTVNEEVPSTGEASTGTLIILGIVTLIVASVIFRKRIK